MEVREFSKSASRRLTTIFKRCPQCWTQGLTRHIVATKFIWVKDKHAGCDGNEWVFP